MCIRDRKKCIYVQKHSVSGWSVGLTEGHPPTVSHLQTPRSQAIRIYESRRPQNGTTERILSREEIPGSQTDGVSRDSPHLVQLPGTPPPPSPVCQAHTLGLPYICSNPAEGQLLSCTTLKWYVLGGDGDGGKPPGITVLTPNLSPLGITPGTRPREFVVKQSGMHKSPNTCLLYTSRCV